MRPRCATNGRDKTVPQQPVEPAVALVTGAGWGIGRATADLLHDRGFRVFGTSRTPNAHPQPAYPLLALQTSDEADVQRLVDAILQDAGRLDLLVNNIGGGIAGAVEETTIDEAQHVFDVNLWSAVRMTRAVLPHMRARHTGRIIVLSFAADLVGIPFRGYYTASKFALESVFEAMSHEVAAAGVWVSIVKPAAVATPAADRVPQAAAHLAAYHPARERLSALFDGAMRTGMPPERVARAILRAATTRRPRLRHRVGGLARALHAAQTLLPHAATSALLRRLVAHRPT